MKETIEFEERTLTSNIVHVTPDEPQPTRETKADRLHASLEAHRAAEDRKWADGQATYRAAAVRREAAISASVEQRAPRGADRR